MYVYLCKWILYGIIIIDNRSKATDNSKLSEKVGRKAVGPEMDCKVAEVWEVMAYTIFGMGF